MDASNDIDDSVIISVISNVHKMLLNRGFDMSKVNRYPAQEHLHKMISLFRSGQNSLDLYLENTDDSKEFFGKKAYVHFMMNMQNIKKPNEKSIKLIKGGSERFKSSKKALEYIKKKKFKYVFIHDAARPNFSIQLLKK